MNNAISTLLTSLLVVSAAGCGRYEAARDAQIQADEAARNADAAAQAEADDAAGAGEPAATGPPTFAAPEGWTEQPPANAMRFKEYKLGTGDDAPLLIVAHWPNGVGPVADNIARWTGAISDEVAPATTDEIVRDGLRITTVDGSGTMALGMSDGAQAGRRMLAAFVDSPGGRFGGAYTIKVVADTSALEPWVESFHAFLAGL